MFVRTVSTGVTQRVSVSTTGGQANGASAGPDVTVRGGVGFGPSISADGTLVAFDPIASNLGPGDTTCSINDQVNFTDHPGQCPDIYVHSS